MSIGPILLQIVLIFLNAVFASAEIAVISMNDARLKQLTAQGNKSAQRITALTEQPARFLATIQVAITLAGLLGSAFAADNFAEPLVALLVQMGISVNPSILKTICVFIITMILAYFNLVFGELVPKRIAMKKPESMALSMAGLLHIVSILFKPLVALLTNSTNFILKLLRVDPNGEEEKVTEEEIRMLLSTGNEQGTIDIAESELIQNVFEFNDTTIGHICTHRLDVQALDVEEELDVWERIIGESRHSLYPVYGADSDDIIGVLDTKDYFRLNDRSNKDTIMDQAVDSPRFVPEGMHANTLFKRMKEERTYFYIVLDEYGGVAGIITIQDLVESLVGEIGEDEEMGQEIKKVDENKWRLKGFTPLSSVMDALDISLPTEHYDTFAGYIYSLIDRIPDDGEQFFCEDGRLKIKVETVVNHRIMDTTVQLVGDEMV